MQHPEEAHKSGFCLFIHHATDSGPVSEAIRLVNSRILVGGGPQPQSDSKGTSQEDQTTSGKTQHQTQ